MLKKFICVLLLVVCVWNFQGVFAGDLRKECLDEGGTWENGKCITKEEKKCKSNGGYWFNEQCVDCIWIDGKCVESPKYNDIYVSNDIKNLTKNAWATISVIVQILSIACVVFAGVRYMFASAEQKADIKGGMINLMIGAVIVFGTTTIIQFVVNVAQEIITK